MIKVFFSHESKRSRFAPLIDLRYRWHCLKPVRDIDQALLRQFIDAMNLVDSLLHISPIFRSQVGSDLCCWMARCLLKWIQISVVQVGWMYRALGEQDRCFAGRWRTRHRSHAWQAVVFESEAPHGSNTCAIDLHSNIDEYHIRSRSPHIGETPCTPSLTCWQSNVSAADATCLSRRIDAIILTIFVCGYINQKC